MLHHAQSLQIRLEHPTNSKLITVHYDGSVEVPGNVRGPAPHEFKPNAVNRLRLLRDRNVYQVFLNDAEGPSNRVEYTGAFEGIRLSITAGEYYGLARIYSVKVGQLTPPEGGVPAVAAPGTVTLVQEDFSQVKLGQIPEGWVGDGWVKGHDKRGKPSLELTKPEGQYRLSRPAMSLQGDFFLEFEFTVWHGQSFGIQLEGLPLTWALDLDSGGNLQLPEVAERKLEKFQNGIPVRLRLVREGDLYQVSLNDDVVAGKQYSYKGPFEFLHLELTAGSYYGPARLYSVRAGLLNVANKESIKPPAVKTLVYEDFSQANKVGALPKDWAGLQGLVTVQREKERGFLSLSSTPADKITDAVRLPS